MGLFLRSIRAIIVIGIALAIASVLYSLREKPEKKEKIKVIPVAEVFTANPESVTMKVEAFGTVKPRKSVKIIAEVPGRIDYINPRFVEGGFLKKGELIFKIDSRTYKLNRDAAIVNISQAKADIGRIEQEITNYKADLELARLNQKLATQEFNRITKLTEQKYATKAQLDSTEMAKLQASMKVQDINNRLALTDSVMVQKQSVLKMTRVELEKANLALGKTRIRASFAGYVMDKFVEDGEYVGTAQPLGHIYLKSKLDVDVSIPLEKMKWLDSAMKNGSMPKVHISKDSSTGTDSNSWQGKVVRVKANIDEKTRTLPMTIEIENSDEKGDNLNILRPGTFVKCSIQGDKYHDVFILPRYLLKQTTLFIVKEGELQSQNVKVLRKFEERVYIQSGLKKGDKILSTPIPGAMHGMKVKVKG